MATGFVTNRGQVIGGRLGEAMANANPNQGVSINPNASNPFRRGGSGGGGGNSSSSNADAQAQQQARAKAEAERKKQEEEARKKFEAEQKAKQEKAFGQTTTGQLTKQDGSKLQSTKLGIYDPETKTYYDENTGMPKNVVSKPEEPKGYVTGLFNSFGRKSDIERTKSLRGQESSASSISFASPFVGLGGLGYGLVTKPIETTKAVAKGLYGVGKQSALFLVGKAESPGAVVGKTFRNEPDVFIGRLAGEFALAGTLTAGGSVASSVGSKVVTRLSPKFRAVTETAEGTRIIENIPSKSGGTLSIPIQERLPTMSLPEQARLAGTEQNLVSGARDLFGVVTKRQRVIEKPIAGEDLLSPKTKGMLEQFTKGTLPSKDVPALNKRIIAETGSKGLLERTFFADPLGRIRPSRLGVEPQKIASPLDIISGDVTFRKAKPQAILFEKETIAKFPKGLSDIESALKKGKSLTQSQQDRLLKWQVAGGSQFKPVGFYSREAEVTLAQGNILKRKGTPAITLIEGKRVPIIRAEVSRASEELGGLLRKQTTKGLTEGESARLSKLLTRESKGLSYDIATKPYAPPSSILGIIKYSSRYARSRASSYKPSSILSVSGSSALGTSKSPISKVTGYSGRSSGKSTTYYKPYPKSSYSGNYGTSVIYGSPAPSTPRIPKPILFKKGIPFKEKPLTFKVIKPSETAYQPSFTASTLNIRKSSKPILGGSLQVRNIIGAPIRRKKKRRKKQL
jgi:hypothetical protein